MRPLERHYHPIRPSNREPHDSVRWFVVGAHQAGCSPARISDMTDLSENAVRSIIRNFQHTGSPSLRRLPHGGTRIPGLITAEDVVQHVLQQAQEHDDQNGWTADDDRELLRFVLNRLNGTRWGDHRWEQLSSTLNDRYSPQECEERWNLLRPILLGAMNLSGTQGW